MITDDARHLRRRARYGGGLMPRQLKTYVCAEVACGTEFTALDPRAKYCGKLCRQQAWRRRNPQGTHRPDIPCGVCGEDFTPKFNGHLYCKQVCRRRAQTRAALAARVQARGGRPARRGRPRKTTTNGATR